MSVIVKSLLIAVPLAFVFGGVASAAGAPMWVAAVGGIAIGLATRWALA